MSFWIHFFPLCEYTEEMHGQKELGLLSCWKLGFWQSLVKIVSDLRGICSSQKPSIKKKINLPQLTQSYESSFCLPGNRATINERGQEESDLEEYISILYPSKLFPKQFLSLLQEKKAKKLPSHHVSREKSPLSSLYSQPFLLITYDWRQITVIPRGFPEEINSPT